jgi:hypothetical protein
LRLLCVVFAVAVAVFGVHIASLAGFLGMALCFGLLTASLGLVIAAFGKTPEAARRIAMFAVLIMVMLGGAWMPSFLFPEWMQQLTMAVPTRWAVDGLDAVTWRGMDALAVVPAMGVQLGFALVFGLLAVWKFSARAAVIPAKDRGQHRPPYMPAHPVPTFARYQIRRQIALGILFRQPTARRHIVQLVLPDLPDHEVLRFRVREVEARHRRARVHRERFRQLHADLLGLQGLEQLGLDRVLRAGRVARRRADAHIGFLDQLLVAQGLVAVRSPTGRCARARACTRQRLRPGGRPGPSP